jgi:hypothetical protein
LLSEEDSSVTDCGVIISQPYGLINSRPPEEGRERGNCREFPAGNAANMIERRAFRRYSRGRKTAGKTPAAQTLKEG